jgi:hypothetical protein
MGQRANLIIVENGEYELYYDHWCANALDRYLFWGVQQAVDFFRKHDQQDENWWLDDVWCEGGAVIDLDKYVLLWFGGEDISYEIPLRRVLLELMQKNWTGWEIVWAYEGIADLADYVGYDRRNVIADKKDEGSFTKQKIIDIFNISEEDSVISIRNLKGEIEIYPMNIAFVLNKFLLYGSDLLKLRQYTNALSEWLYVNRYDGDDSFPKAGIHIDMQNKRIDFWSCREHIFDFDKLAKAWKGYRIVYQKDNFETQLNLTDGKLKFPARSRDLLVKMVKGIVCHDTADPIERLNSTTELIKSQGRDVEVSSAAYIANKFVSDKASQEKLFDELFYSESNMAHLMSVKADADAGRNMIIHDLIEE